MLKIQEVYYAKGKNQKEPLQSDFKVTGTGKLKRMKAYKSHILTKRQQREREILRHAAMTMQLMLRQ